MVVAQLTVQKLRSKDDRRGHLLASRKVAFQSYILHQYNIVYHVSHATVQWASTGQ